MSDDIEQYGLHVPEQLEAEKGGFDVRAKQVAAWIQSLPLGDTEETARKLYAVLAQVNRIDLDPGSRLRMMEQLEEPLHYASASLKKQFQGKSFPLSTRSLKAVDKTMALLTERSYAYKIAVIGLLQKPGLFHKGSLQEAIYYGLLALKDILLTTYQIYAPVPAYLWFELHRLYALAEERGLESKPFKRKEAKTSIAEAYKQALLLSIANPYHLRTQEIIRIHNCSEDWCRYTEIKKPDPREMVTSQYAAVLNTDAPPVHLNLLKTLDGKHTRLLDITGLLLHIRSLLGQDSRDSLFQQMESNFQPDAVLLKRLLVSWEARKKRNFSRSPQGDAIDVSIGLNGTHFLIEAESREELDRLLEPVEHLVEPEEEINPLDIIHTQFSIEPTTGEFKAGFLRDRDVKQRTHTTELQGADVSVGLPAPTYERNSLKTVNVSAGGYCLLWDHDRSSNAQVGELVGLRETSHHDDGSWRIGVVRWMQYVRDKGVKIGIEILSPNASPIYTRTLKRNSRTNLQEYSCLSLPEIRTMHQPASLLTPTLHYKVGDALIVNDHGKLSNVQLTRLIENSGNFLRFQYTPLNEKEEKEFDRSLNEKSGEWFKLLK